MYCNQCGAQVPDHAKFCQACGSAVGAEPNSTAAETPCPEPEPEPQRSDPSVLPDFLAHDDAGEYRLLDESMPNKAIYQAAYDRYLTRQEVAAQ